MCSDAGNGDYTGFNANTGIGSSSQGETITRSEIDLNDILEVLVSFDEPGNFMDPVDDSFAPNYSKLIKNPMCFLKMREKIYSHQYMSWKSFVEDFELICHNAMVYNQKRSEIWNSANSLLRRGKRFLEQQSSWQKAKFGISKKTPGSAFVELKALNKVKYEEANGEPPPTNCAAQNSQQADGMSHTAVEKQESILAYNEAVSVDLSLKDHDLLSNKVSSPANKEGSSVRVVEEDVIVEIVEPVPAEDARIDAEDQATECSSSFGCTQNLEAGDEACEVESQLRDGNGAGDFFEESNQAPRRKKRALNSEWKTFRKGIEWQCRWLELRVKKLQAESNRYDEILAASRERKRHFSEHLDASEAARTGLYTKNNQENKIFRRQQRRKVEENPNLEAYMLRHPVYSRYERKPHRNHEESSADDGPWFEKNQVDWDDFSHEMESSADELTRGEDSMEQLLWHVEALQMHVQKLKNALRKNFTFQQFGQLGSKNVSGSTALYSPSRLGARSVTGGPKVAASTSSRRRNSDFDINDMIMPGNVMANFVEPPRPTFIETPQWRFVESNTLPDEKRIQDEKSSSDEDTDDELCIRRHEEMRKKERQQQYAPLSRQKVLNSVKGSCKTGVVRSLHGGVVKVVNLAPTFGFIPKGKRQKREPRSAAAVSESIKPVLHAAYIGTLEGGQEGHVTSTAQKGAIDNSAAKLS